MNQVHEKEPLISVVIPVYNVRDYLNTCLTSVTENSYRNLEIICVDDGSTDGSSELLNRWRNTDGRIQVITTVNQGVSTVRNIGIRAAKGEYFAFGDSDDYIHHDYFGILLNGINQNQADIGICAFKRVITDEGRNFTCVNEDEIHWRVIDRDHCLNLGNLKYSVWGKLYNRRLITDDFDPAFMVGEDY